MSLVPRLPGGSDPQRTEAETANHDLAADG
jgi:hypothetical protein